MMVLLIFAYAGFLLFLYWIFKNCNEAVIEQAKKS